VISHAANDLDMSNPRTKVELENQLASFSRENENLRKQLAALQAAQLPPEEPVLLKCINAGTYDQSTVWRWGNDGLIRTKLIGKRLFYFQSSVDAHIRRLKGQ
jgi:hypothetical protein